MNLNPVKNQEYYYTLKAPSKPGIYSFNGTFMFENDLDVRIITGFDTIEVIESISPGCIETNGEYYPAKCPDGERVVRGRGRLK